MICTLARFGLPLRALRRERALSQHDLALKAGAPAKPGCLSGSCSPAASPSTAGLMILAALALALALALDHERLLSPCQNEPEASEWRWAWPATATR